MSLVHFLPCTSDLDPELVGGFVRKLVAARADDDVASYRMLLDRPVRARSQAQFEAWTSPLLEGRSEVVDDEATGLFILTRGSLHARSGFEGAVHALAIGTATEQEKAAIQEGLQPRVDRDLCGGCGMCVALCGNRGIRHNGHIAVVQHENCLACGDCLAECFPEALHFPDGGGTRLMERLAAAAATEGARRNRSSFIMLLLLPEPERRLTLSGRHVPQPDLGLICGTDPVAVDQAALDLIAGAHGKSIAELTGCPDNPLLLNEMAESLKVGSRQYVLREWTTADLG